MIRVLVATPLRSCTTGLSEVSLEAGTVAEAMERLMGAYPGLKTQIYDASGTLRCFVNLFLNGEDIRMSDGPVSSLAAGDTLEILLAVAGG